MRAWVNTQARRLPEWAVWVAGLVPLALLVADMILGRLGIDPVRDIEHRLGRTALYLLAASLAVTPLLRFGRINLVRLRRAVGLLAFTYAVLHLGAWLVFDMALLWPQIVKDVLKRPYLVFGMASLGILLVLALTSNAASLRRLGTARWRSLHRLVYLAAPLALLHWVWALKVWEPKPLLWTGVILLLLASRAVPRTSRGGRRIATAVKNPL